MPTAVLDKLEPRDAGVGEFEEVVAGLFTEETQVSAHGVVAQCRSTCVSGFTIRCDGYTL